ncbi:MAG: response regulator [Bacteroidota bacterium]
MSTQTNESKKALIIDDSADTREYLTLLLKKHDFEVVTATDGDEGLTVFKKHRPDVIITDIFMPNKEGLELITEIRNVDSDVGIVAISGYKDKQGGMNYLEVAKQFGAHVSLEKPFDTATLMSHIDEIIS